VANELTRKQLDLLKLLAAYRILSVDEAAVLQGAGQQAARKRLRKLMALGLADGRPHGFGRSRGRPARIYCLSDEGIAYLKSLGRGVSQAADRDAEATTAPNHQLLLNWCLLHLRHWGQSYPQLTVCVAEERHADDNADPSVPARSRRGPSPRTIPDAVFSITRQDRRKVLLFFLEVDMASETVASFSRGKRDFRSKILRYQERFRSGSYKRYEQLWGCQLQGFRLLVVTNSRKRMSSLCRLVREMPPSDFVWLTHQAALFASGISAPIWVQGGRRDHLLQSIVGPTLARVEPLLPVRP
jgi:hypothetical protein